MGVNTNLRDKPFPYPVFVRYVTSRHGHRRSCTSIPLLHRPFCAIPLPLATYLSLILYIAIAVFEKFVTFLAFMRNTIRKTFARQHNDEPMPAF